MDFSSWHRSLCVAAFSARGLCSLIEALGRNIKRKSSDSYIFCTYSLVCEAKRPLVLWFIHYWLSIYTYIYIHVCIGLIGLIYVIKNTFATNWIRIFIPNITFPRWTATRYILSVLRDATIIASSQHRRDLQESLISLHAAIPLYLAYLRGIIYSPDTETEFISCIYNGGWWVIRFHTPELESLG